MHLVTLNANEVLVLTESKQLSDLVFLLGRIIYLQYYLRDSRRRSKKF